MTSPLLCFYARWCLSVASQPLLRHDEWMGDDRKCPCTRPPPGPPLAGGWPWSRVPQVQGKWPGLGSGKSVDLLVAQLWGSGPPIPASEPSVRPALRGCVAGGSPGPHEVTLPSSPSRWADTWPGFLALPREEAGASFLLSPGFLLGSREWVATAGVQLWPEPTGIGWEGAVIWGQIHSPPLSEAGWALGSMWP